MKDSASPSKQMPHGLILLCLLTLLMLSGCQALPRRVEAPVSVPVQYTVPTQEPEATGSTNGALALLAKSFKKALASCNADKAAILDWSTTVAPTQ